VGILAHEFPGCAHVRNTGLRASEDGKIWDHARTNGFVIISKDTDFRERSYVEGFPPKIFRSSGVALRRRRLDPMKKLVALSIGVLAAVKLLLRLQNRGKTVYAGDPHVWEIVEQASDDLAADHFQHIAGDFSSAGIPGMRLKGERAYLHLVQNRERFQWCPAQINDDETSPFPPGTMHEAVPEVGDAVTFAIIGVSGSATNSTSPVDPA
jgi:hypothetical protein